VFAPGKSSVQMYSQVLNFVSLGQLVVVKLNGGTHVPFEGKGNLIQKSNKIQTPTLNVLLSAWLGYVIFVRKIGSFFDDFSASEDRITL
jgi:hypothetical protein